MRETISAVFRNLRFSHLNSSVNLKLHFSIAATSNHFSHGNEEGNTRRKLIKLLQESANVGSLTKTKVFHALTVTLGSHPSQPVFPYNSIISRYEELGEVSTARKLFDRMSQRNAVSYNTMIKAHCRDEDLREAWKLFSRMRYSGFRPNEFTFGSVLSCTSTLLFEGLQLLALVLKCGYLETDAYVGTALMFFFGKHGCLDEAIHVFEAMPVKNLVTWNCLISLFGRLGFVEDSILLFIEVMRRGLLISESSLVGALSGLTRTFDLGLGRQVHNFAVKFGMDGSVLVSNSLIHMYATCLDIYSAEKIFEGLPAKDNVSWNTMIRGMARTDRPEKAFELFFLMCHNGISPNDSTFTSILNSVSSMKLPLYGQYIHAKTIKTSLDSDLYVGSALVDFYAKVGNLEDAHICFVKIPEKNLVSWNSLIAGYSNMGSPVSLLLLQDMIRLDYCPNEFSLSSALKSCKAIEVQQLHSLILKRGYEDNEHVWSSLITSYAKSGHIADAYTFVQCIETPLPVVLSNVVAAVYNRTGQYEKTQELFSALEEPDLFSWNILIAACSRNGDYEEAFDLFSHMQEASVRPDNYTYVSLFSTCTNLCNLALGSSLHGLILKTDSHPDTILCNVVMDMYAKCGNFDSSIKIFNEMTNKNHISWTVLISAYGLHGFAYEALEMFRRMEMERFKPDKVTFLAVISACRHAGLVKQGMEVFQQMRSNYSIEPDMNHYVMVVDLLARYGHLREAEELINQMPFPPNAIVWRSFLEGCRRQRNRASSQKRLCEV